MFALALAEMLRSISRRPVAAGGLTSSSVGDVDVDEVDDGGGSDTDEMSVYTTVLLGDAAGMRDGDE